MGLVGSCIGRFGSLAFDDLVSDTDLCLVIGYRLLRASLVGKDLAWAITTGIVLSTGSFLDLSMAPSYQSSRRRL